MNQHSKAPEQKQAITDSMNAQKSRTSDHTATVRQFFDKSTREDLLKPFTYGTLGLATVRETSFEDPGEMDCGTGWEGQTVTTPKRKTQGGLAASCLNTQPQVATR